jgi:hypothetical protein
MLNVDVATFLSFYNARHWRSEICARGSERRPEGRAERAFLRPRTNQRRGTLRRNPPERAVCARTTKFADASEQIEAALPLWELFAGLWPLLAEALDPSADAGPVPLATALGKLERNMLAGSVSAQVAAM